MDFFCGLVGCFYSPRQNQYGAISPFFLHHNVTSNNFSDEWWACAHRLAKTRALSQILKKLLICHFL